MKTMRIPRISKVVPSPGDTKYYHITWEDILPRMNVLPKVLDELMAWQYKEFGETDATRQYKLNKRRIDPIEKITPETFKLIQELIKEYNNENVRKTRFSLVVSVEAQEPNRFVLSFQNGESMNVSAEELSKIMTAQYLKYGISPAFYQAQDLLASPISQPLNEYIIEKNMTTPAVIRLEVPGHPAPRSEFWKGVDLD